MKQFLIFIALLLVAGIAQVFVQLPFQLLVCGLAGIYLLRDRKMDEELRKIVRFVTGLCFLVFGVSLLINL